MRKITILFAALLSLMGTTVKAETLTANFNSGLPEGWSIVGDLTRDSDRARSGSGVWTASKSDNANYLITEAVEGSITFYARAYNKSTDAYVFIYKYNGSALGDQIYVTSNMKTSSTPSWSSYTASLGSYKGQVAIALNYAAIDDVTYTQMEVAEGPALSVKDGETKLTSPYAYDFGLTVAGTEKVFTLSNPGTAAVGVSVSKTGSFGATLSATTIAAGGEATLTVTMPSTSGSGTVTITPDATGVSPFVINVSGTVRDPKKVYETLASLPEDWTTTGTWSFNSTNGATTTAWYLSSNARLCTPLLTISEGETFIFEAKGNYDGYHDVQLEYSANGTDWTASATDITLTSDWQTITINDIPAGSYYIALHTAYASIRNFYGGELPQEPKMVVTQPASLDFGVISEATTKTFTIANTGLATLEGINVTSSNATFTVTGAPTSLEAGASAEVTITMAATATGALSSDITVSATGMTDVQFTVTGIVLPEGLMVVDFNDNQLPANWTNAASNKWSFSEGKAYCTSAAELVTPKLLVTDGDMLAITATSYDNYDNNYLEVYASTDGTSWDLIQRFISRSQIPYGSYATLVVTSIPQATKYLKFKGYYVRVDEIAGLTYDMNAPVMSFTAEDFVAGKVTGNASKTYTVSNTGTGTLTVNIASDSEKFTVEPAQLVITDEPKDFTVTFNYDASDFGKFNANITVTPTYDESAAVTFAASAQVVNPNLWEEDFEEGTLPQGWVANNWTIGKSNNYENDTYMALAPSTYNTVGTLTTPCLTAKEGDVLTWDAYFRFDDEALKVEWLSDNQETWTELYNYTAASESLGSNSHKEMSFTAPADGEYYLRFTSTYSNGVDNFQGFKLAQKEHEMNITASNIPATGNQYVAYTATVTVKELAGKEEEVEAALLIDGAEVATAYETVEANGSKVLSLTFTPEEALVGVEVKIVVTYAGGTLETEATNLTITAAPTLDEEDGSLAGFANFASYPVVAMKYSLKAGWNTIILPFGYSDLSVFGEDAEAFQLNSYADGVLNFSKTTTLNPQTPYVIYATEAKSELIFTDVTNFRTSTDADDLYARISSSGIKFQGTYAPIAAGEWNASGTVYGVTTTGYIQKAGANASIKGFRAYFDVTDATEVKAINFEGNDATGIANLKDLKDADDLIYNIAGQRLQKMQKGINIINGKKVLK